MLGITVGSNKSLVGKNSATIKGKGIRMNSVSNIIIQNVAFTDINPKYVWGGDAITLDDTDMVWIDHVTVSVPWPGKTTHRESSADHMLAHLPRLPRLAASTLSSVLRLPAA